MKKSKINISNVYFVYNTVRKSVLKCSITKLELELKLTMAKLRKYQGVPKVLLKIFYNRFMPSKSIYNVFLSRLNVLALVLINILKF